MVKMDRDIKLTKVKKKSDKDAANELVSNIIRKYMPMYIADHG